VITMTERTDRLWSVQDVAEYVGVPRKTLCQWRHHGVGPRARRVGRYLRYDEQDVRDWFTALDDGVA